MPVHEQVQTREQVPVWLPEALHDLSQPITALACGLFVGTMSPDGIRNPQAEELLATIQEALGQCERITLSLRAIQARMAQSDSN